MSKVQFFCCTREARQDQSYLQVVDSLLERRNLRSTVGSVHHDVAAGSNGSPQNGHLSQFLFRNELVVSPPDRDAQKGNVHPTAVIGYEHGRAALLVKVLQHLWVFDGGVASCQMHECDAPDVAQKDRDSALPFH